MVSSWQLTKETKGVDTMAKNTIDILELVRKQQGGEEALDFLREAVAVTVRAIMEAEVSALAAAGYGERTPERVAVRNGYRERSWDTRAGTLELAIPKLRTGSYFPTFLEPRRRSEQALLSVVQQAYVEGVSTRRVDDLVRSLGCDGISRSQVSRICKELDQVVSAFKDRPLDTGPYPYVWLDALSQKVRENGRVVSVAVAVATGVNREGKREVLGVDVGASEDGAFWLSFLRSLVSRGLRGVQLVTSDAHAGLKEAIGSVFLGASWQRCRTHFTTNLLTKVPRSAQPFVATIVRSIYQQSTPEDVLERHGAAVEQLRERFPEAAVMLAEAAPEILAFTAFPAVHWRQIWSNNPQERLNKEIRRRTDVVGIFPSRQAAIRLIGAVLAEQNDEWLVARRYLSDESMKPLFVRALPPLPPPEVNSDTSPIAV
jgi:putative transposase